MKNVQLNRDYNIYVRDVLETRHEMLKGKRGEERRAILDKWHIRIKKVRYEMKNIGEEQDTIICDDHGEGVTVIYREPFEFEGTKKELYEYLWENCATRIYSEYDCTGKKFTSWYMVGYLGNNKWKIAEHFAVDV